MNSVLKASRNILCLSTLLTLVMSYNAISDTLELSTLEWPPFTGSRLINKGITSQIVEHALNNEGHKLRITVLPWNRAIRMVKMGYAAGYFPEYDTATDEFLLSDSLGHSSLGLLERKTDPIAWHNVSDLNNYTLGVITGYLNTVEIDAMILDGSQKIETARNDKQNILKLAAGRINAIIIDVNVYDFLKSDPQIAEIADLLQINEKILESKSLHVAFENNQQGKKWLEILNNGLSKFNPQAVLDASLQEMRQNK
ncbi:substrate-binding periplasmic protein [Shewanella vesiculosa]|uniref:substrate-binding periplasmic protein n=1 Tax=Shewanella vesiculosa TaxID=518738 RepID=UPI003D0098F9